MITLLIRLLIALTGFSIAGFFAARFLFRTARSALRLAADDPAEKALLIARRIQAALEATKAGVLYGSVLDQLNDLVQTRLPRLAETRDSLETFLHQKSQAELERQVRAIEADLAAARDPEIRSLTEKNLKIAKERMEMRRAMEVVHARTVAQLKNALMTLEALEDRVQSVKLLPEGGGMGKELGSMLEDVSHLESEYRKLRLMEGDPEDPVRRADPSLAAETENAEPDGKSRDSRTRERR